MQYLRYGDLVTVSVSDTLTLFSKGFIDSSLKLLDPTNKDYFYCVFRVFPQTIHSLQTEIMSLSTTTTAENFRDSVIRLKETAEGEIKTNIQIYTNFVNQPVKFGSLIQLQHLASGRLLSVNSKENADIEKDNLKVSLIDFFSDASLIRILPAFKYQKEGDGLITYSDRIVFEIVIPETNKAGFLHSSSQISLYDNEVNLSFDIKTNWRLTLYTGNTEPSILLSGNHYWLTHSELGTSIIKQSNLLLLTNSTDDSNGIWTIESENSSQCEQIKSGVAYRIKHFCSGMYLTLKIEFKKGRTKSKAALSYKKDIYSLWKFVHIYKKKKYLQKDDMCHVINCETGSVLDGALNKEIPVLRNSDYETAFFKLFRCEDLTIRQTLLLMNCVGPIKMYAECIGDLGSLEQRVKEFLVSSERMNKCLETLSLFCSNKLIGVIDFDKQLGQIKQARQKILKEQQFIELLTDILSKLNVDFLHIKSSEGNFLSSLLEKVTMITEKIYMILIIICKNNSENQVFAYNFIDIYKQHANYYQIATGLILSIVDNNEKLLYSISRPPCSLIQHYTWLLRKNAQMRKPHLVHFLKCICLYNGDSVKLTQEKIHEHLFENTETFTKAVLSTVSQGDTLGIVLPGVNGEYSILLDECFTNSNISEKHKTHILYFNRMLELFAELCRDRNYTCKGSLKDWFPVNVLLHYIWDTNISSDLRASFVKLMLTMYIDSHPRHEERLPESVKILSLQDKEDPGLKYKSLFTFLVMDTSVEAIRKNIKKYTVFKRDKDANTLGRIKFKNEQLIMYKLKEDLIDYMDKAIESPIFDELLYELIVLGGYLVRFKVISNVKSIARDSVGILNTEDKEFVYSELDLARLLRPLFHMLKLSKQFQVLYKKRTALGIDNQKRSSKTLIPEISNSVFDNFEQSPMAETLKIFTNYVKSVTTAEEIDDGFEYKCKIEICKILEYVLNSRVDFLINNTIAWFNTATELHSIEEFLKLFPSLCTDLIENQNEKYQLFVEPEVKELNFYMPNALPELIRQFVESKDYELQTLLLKIIFKSFYIRAKMLKQISRIQVITNKENSEIYIWVKEKVQLIKQLAEQSELWLYYWNQSGSTKEMSIEKIILIRGAFEDIIESLDEDSKVESDELIRGTSGKINKNRQNIYFNMGIHRILISLLQDSMQSVSDLYQSSSNDIKNEAKARYKVLFKACHSLLEHLAMKNTKIQESLHRSLNVFLAYIHLPLGQIDLISAIFKGNDKLCKQVDESLLRIFTDLIRKYGRQAKFLDLFEVIQTVKNETIVDNQRTVVKVLLEGDYHYTCYMVPGVKNEFNIEINEENSALVDGYTDEPFLYHSKLIEILSISAYGNSGVYLTEMKCQKLIRLEYIFEILSLKDQSFYNSLFIPMLKFFYHVYIDTEKINENVINSPLLMKFIGKQAEELHLNFFLTQDDFTIIEFMVDIIAKYSTLYIKGEFFDLTYDTIKGYIEVLLEKFEILTESSINPKTIEKIELLGSKYNIEFPPIIHVGDHDHDMPTTNMTKLRGAWSDFKNDILYNENLKSLLKAEKQELNALVTKISEFMPEMSTNKIIICMLEYVKNFSMYKPKVSLLNKVLMFMVYFLSHGEDEEFINTIKTQLNEHGIVRTIMALLCDPSTGQKTFFYLLLLSCELLEDGNFLIQSSFLSYFSTNESSQDFFHKIHIYLLNFTSTSKNIWGKKQVIYKKKTSGCKTVLRFLQLLCENHNESLQNYLRVQHNARHSYNLVLTVIFLLEEMLKKSNEHHFFEISQCFDTLTELIQGPCKKNQIAIVDSKLLETASRLLSFDEKCDNMSKYHLLKEEILSTSGSRDEFSANCLKGWMLAHLKYKCMITLLSLLEGQTDNYVITRLIRSLNLEVLKENIISLYFSYTDMYPPGYYEDAIFNHHENNSKYNPHSSAEYEDNPEYYQLVIEVGFMVYHLMCHFKDNDDPENKRIIKNELPDLLVQEQKSAFFGAKLLGDLGKIGLGFLKTGFSAMKKMVRKQKAKLEVTETEKFKLLSDAYQFFQKNTGNIEIVFRDEIFRIYFWIRPEGHYITEDQKENFHFYVDRSSDKAKVQYLLMKADDTIEEMIHEFKLAKFFNRYKLIALVASNVRVWKDLAFIMTLCLNFIIISSFYSNSSGRASGEAFVYSSGNQKITQSLMNVFGSILMACSCCIVSFFLLKTAPVLIARGWRNLESTTREQNCLVRLYTKCKNGILTVFFALSNVDVLYQICFLIFAVFGTAVHPFFFAFHLLDVMYRYPTLQSVIKAIVIPRKSLLLSFMLILVLLYLFSIWIFLAFSKYFEESDCKTMIRCFKLVFDQGLKCGGGIGDYANNYFDPVYNDYFKLLMDTLFFIIINIIMLNVIQGIIIDTFAYLRAMTEMNTADRENKCFICSLEKEYIEYATNRPMSFHTTYEHNEWNYIAFINYLKVKDPNELTGMESYLSDLIEKNDCSWIPQQRSLSIKMKKDGEENLLRKKLENVDRIYATLEREMKETKKSFTEYLESKHIMQNPGEEIDED